MTEETELMGEVYQAESGQWSFAIKGNDCVEYCRGGGFETEQEAYEELNKLLLEMM
jgi:hypothetical protein